MDQLTEIIHTPYIVCPIVAMIVIFYVLMVISNRKEKKPEVILEPEPEPINLPSVCDQIKESGEMAIM